MKSLRRQIEEAADRAAAVGYPDPAGLFSMTPREIEWALTAFAAAGRRQMERADALAWLTGRYCAVGINNPARYPRKPDGVRPADMSEEDMKAVFLSMTGAGKGGNV